MSRASLPSPLEMFPLSLKNLALFVLASALVLNGCSSCGDPGVDTGRPAVASKLAFTVEPTRAAAGSALTPAVRVTVQDADGKPVTGAQATVTLSLKANPTGATLSGAAPVETAHGEATFPGLSLDKAGEGYTLVAHAEGLEDATSQAFGIEAGPARQLAFAAQPDATEAGGNFGPLVRVSVRDASGNPVKEGTPVTLALGANPVGGTLSGTLTVQATGGEALFSELALDNAGEGYTLVASAPGLDSVTSAAFRVKPGKARALAFLTQPSAVGAGLAMSPAVQVRLVDAHGNTATGTSGGVTLALASAAPGVTLAGTLTVAAVDGVATFPDLSVARSGTYALTASSPTLEDATSQSFLVTAGAAAQLAFRVQPLDAVAGDALAPAVEVEVLDAQGNVASGFSGPVTVALDANPTADSLRGTLTVNAVAGVARFDTLSLIRAGVGYSLAAASPGLTPAVSWPFDVSAGAAARLAFAVQPSRARLGTELSPAVRVSIEDAFGNPVPSASNTITVALGSNPAGGTLGGELSVGATSGVASFSTLTVDKIGSGYTLVASSAGLTSATSSAFDISAGAPAKLAFRVQPSTVAAGSPIAPAVEVAVQDAFGNAVTDSTASITVALGAAPAGATLSGTLNQAATGGVARFDTLSLSRAGTGYTLQASSPGLTPAGSASFDVTPGAAKALAFTAQPTDAAAGTSLTPAVRVSVLDAFGNTVTGSSAAIQLTLASNPSAGTLSGTLTASASGGVATFSNLSLDKAGTGYSLGASSSGLTDATSTLFDVTPGAAKALAFSVQPSSVTAGAALSPAVAVRVLDAFGNAVTSSTASITVAVGNNPGGGTLGGTVTVGAVGGVATFTGLSLDKAGTGYTLTAASSGLTSATSEAFDVTPGAPAALAFSTQPPSSVTAGVAFSPAVRVSVADAFGNTVTSSSTSITLSLSTNPGGATLGGTLTVAAVGGVATFPGLTLDKAATGYRLAADASGLTSASSTLFNVVAGPASRLVFSTQPANVTAGTAFGTPVRVTVQDDFGNTVTSPSFTVSAAIGNNPGGSTLGGTPSVTTASGVATFTNLTLNKAGTGYTLVASSSTLPAGTATSTAFDVAAGAASQLVFTVQPTNTPAGTPFSPAVQVAVRDAFGNAVTGSSASITLGLGNNPSGATLSGTTTVAASSGVATFPGVSLAKAGTGYTLTASASGLAGGTSLPFDVAAGAPSQLAFTVQPSNGTTGQALNPAVRVTVQDDFGNAVTDSSASITLALGNNPSGATLSGTTTVAASSGVATFSNLVLDKAGTGYTLVASASGLASVTSAAFDLVTPIRLVYTAPAPGGSIALVLNPASTNSTVVLDLVALVNLTGYSVGFNLPLDTSRVQANATLMSPGTALPAGSAPTAAYGRLPSSGPLAGMLSSGQSQKAAGTGAVVSDSAIAAGSVFYTVRLDMKAGASTGVVFDGAALGPKFRALLRDKLGTDVVSSNAFAIGRLEVVQ